MQLRHDKKDFERTVRAFSADLYRFAYWLCRDRFLAEDLVQEAFARGWRNWSELRDPSLAKAWLMTILRHEYARTFGRNRLDVVHEADESELPSIPSFERGLELDQILAMLPMSYREPLLLQTIGGFSCREIAAMLATSEGAVMTRLTRARQALRAQFADADRKRARK